MDDALLWLWLFVLPATIGLFVGTWLACLGLGLAYLILVDLDTPIAADNLMIAAVALSCHGLRREFRRAG